MITTHLHHRTSSAATARAATEALNRGLLKKRTLAVKSCPGGYRVVTAVAAHQPFARAFVLGFLAGRQRRAGK